MLDHLIRLIGDILETDGPSGNATVHRARKSGVSGGTPEDDEETVT
jgi:hypothetical protein